MNAPVLRESLKTVNCAEIQEILLQVRAVFPVVSLNTQTHDRAMQLVQRYHLSIYDATIVAAALLAGCSTLYSEDMQDGQVIEQVLMSRNPF